MQNNLVETLIGAIVVAVAAVFLFYGYRTVGIHASSGYDVTANFDRVDGLANGSDVRMSGIKIGTVAAQKLNPKTYQAVVTVRLDSNVAVPDDSNARITSGGLLGSNYISISPGGSTEMLKDGDAIEYTQGSVDLMGLLGQAIFSAKSDSSKSGGSDSAATSAPNAGSK